MNKYFPILLQEHSYLSILPDDNVDMFAVAMLMSYCYSLSPILSSTVMITLYASSSRWNELSEGKVVSMNKNKNGFTVYFHYSS